MYNRKFSNTAGWSQESVMPSDETVTQGSSEDIVTKYLAATVGQLFGVMLGKITGKVIFFQLHLQQMFDDTLEVSKETILSF